MMLSGVSSSTSTGRMARVPTIISRIEATAVKVMELPMVLDRFSLSRDPKY